MPIVDPPVVTVDDEFFWRGVEEGRLLFRCCDGCGTLQHPPIPMCPICGSTEWTAKESPGRGTVHSWIVSRHPTQSDDRPRIAVLVQLDEGVRIVSNLVEVEPHLVRTDMEVEVLFAGVDDVLLPQFRPRPSVVESVIRC